MTSVLLADDQHLVRAGFRLILSTQFDIDVVGEATTGEEAVALVAQTKPDVVLMDIQMPGMGGIEATRRITHSATNHSRVLILTTYDLDEYVYDAIQAGASGFLLKDLPPEQLGHAVKTVSAGDALLAPAITRRLIEEFANTKRRPASDVLSALSDREVDVFTLLARGHSNAEIARELFVAETTVKTHVTRILAKLELRDRIQAVVFAYETGLIAPGHD